MALATWFSLSALILLYPTVAHADLVWPAMYLEQRILTWWAVGVGLLAEWPAVRHITSWNWAKSAWPTIAINFASTLLGVALIPLAGIGWEFFPGVLLYEVFHVGTFNPGTWLATLVLAVFINAVVELFALKLIFKIRFSKRGFWILALANTASVGAALASVGIAPIR